MNASIARASTFDREWARAYAAEVLAHPPLYDVIERPVISGTLVVSFVLPLELCKPVNRVNQAQPWMFARLKRDVFNCMAAQVHSRCTEPLPGRPQVVCVRFSCIATDGWTGNSFKAAIDCLGPMRHPKPGVKGSKQKLGLGIIADDSIWKIKEHQRWEPAPRALGFGLVQVWTGESA